MLLYQVLAYTMHGIKRFKYQLQHGMKNLNEFPDESYSISDIQEYFEYILKNLQKRLLILQ